MNTLVSAYVQTPTFSPPQGIDRMVIFFSLSFFLVWFGLFVPFLDFVPTTPLTEPCVTYVRTSTNPSPPIPNPNLTVLTVTVC